MRDAVARHGLRTGETKKRPDVKAGPLTKDWFYALDAEEFKRLTKLGL